MTGVILSDDKVNNILNEQDKEIKSLKKENEQLKEENKHLQKRTMILQDKLKGLIK